MWTPVANCSKDLFDLALAGLIVLLVAGNYRTKIECQNDVVKPMSTQWTFSIK